jgi:hypothetical protein
MTVKKICRNRVDSECKYYMKTLLSLLLSPPLNGSTSNDPKLDCFCRGLVTVSAVIGLLNLFPMILFLVGEATVLPSLVCGLLLNTLGTTLSGFATVVDDSANVGLVAIAEPAVEALVEFRIGARIGLGERQIGEQL